MRVLITGASGLLGSKLAELAVKHGYEVYSGYNRNKSIRGKPVKLDVSDKEAVKNAFKHIKPEAVIHTAALTDVDKCETEKESAWKINVEGTQNIVEECKKYNAFLVYVSTDYVFEGSKGMYKEEDKCKPVNYYGFTKLEGEKKVSTLDEWCIARASVIYGANPATGKTNFALWVLESLRKGEPIRVLADQWVSPTLNINLSEMVLEALEKRLTGIFHLAGATRVSRLEMAKLIAKTFKLNDRLIKPILMKDIVWKARRPADSSLDVSKAKSMLSNKPLNLDGALKELKNELATKTF